MKTLAIVTIDTPKQFDIATLFGHLQAKEGAILLDSGSSQHPNARFSIAVASPVLTLTGASCEGSLQVSDPTGLLPAPLATALQNQPMPTQIAQIQTCLFGGYTVPDSHLPFGVGAIGYLSYDWGKTQENVQGSCPSQYRTPQVQIGFYPWSLIWDLHQQQLFFCYADDLPHPPMSEVQQMAQKPVAASTSAGGYQIQDNWQSNLTRAEYVHKIARVHAYLTAGDCYQINLAQRFHNRYRGDEWSIYRTLRQHNNAPFSSFIRTEHGAITSISPERFLKVQDNLVETKPIKGTRPRLPDPVADAQMAKELQGTTKDKAENLMIVDLLRNDLSKNCLPNSVKVPSLFAVESFPAVHHLVSTVTGELKASSSPLQLLQDAFPGGSITGAPKIRAMEIIEELEPDPRHIYCGSIFYTGINGDMDSNICIRTLLLEHGDIYCWAGGVVADSEAQHEYQETLDKVAKILPILAAE